jgi:hypothetical protein
MQTSTGEVELGTEDKSTGILTADWVGPILDLFIWNATCAWSICRHPRRKDRWKNGGVDSSCKIVAEGSASGTAQLSIEGRKAVAADSPRLDR